MKYHDFLNNYCGHASRNIQQYLRVFWYYSSYPATRENGYVEIILKKLLTFKKLEKKIKIPEKIPSNERDELKKNLDSILEFDAEKIKREALEKSGGVNLREL